MPAEGGAKPVLIFRSGAIDFEWHYGEPLPNFGGRRIYTIVADGDELSYVLSLLRYRPGPQVRMTDADLEAFESKSAWTGHGDDVFVLLRDIRDYYERLGKYAPPQNPPQPEPRTISEILGYGKPVPNYAEAIAETLIRVELVLGKIAQLLERRGGASS